MKDKHIANVANFYICYILIEGLSILHKSTLQKSLWYIQSKASLVNRNTFFWLTPAGEETGHSESHIIPGFKEQRGGIFGLYYQTQRGVAKMSTI